MRRKIINSTINIEIFLFKNLIFLKKNSKFRYLRYISWYISTVNKLTFHQKFKKSKFLFLKYKLFYKRLILFFSFYFQKNYSNMYQKFNKNYISKKKKLFFRTSFISHILYLSLIFQFF